MTSNPKSMLCIGATLGDLPSEIITGLSGTLYSLASLLETRLGVDGENRQLVWTMRFGTKNGSHVLEGDVQITERKLLVTGGLSAAMSSIEVPVSLAACSGITIYRSYASWQEDGPEGLGSLAEKIVGHFMMKQ